jgi:type IV secretory pathway VirB2 component (pilin)
MLEYMASTQPVYSGSAAYGVGWGTLALINTGLAQSKGSSGLLWFLLSLLLGPVATFILVVFVSSKRPPSL